MAKDHVVSHIFANENSFAMMTKKGALFHEIPVTTIMESRSTAFPKMLCYTGVIANGGTIAFVVRTTTSKVKLARARVNKKVGARARETMTVAEVVTTIINKSDCPSLQDYAGVQLTRVAHILTQARGNIKAAQAIIEALNKAEAQAREAASKPQMPKAE